MTDDQEFNAAHEGLTRLLDDVCAGRTVPAGARGRTYAVLDALRGSGAPSIRIRAAERIALTLHRLEWARLRRNDEEEESLWRQLDELTAEWTQRAHRETLAL